VVAAPPPPVAPPAAGAPPLFNVRVWLEFELEQAPNKKITRKHADNTQLISKLPCRTPCDCSPLAGN
jgi:hypothetical protein